MDALLDPIEEISLNIIKNEWDINRRKLNITELKRELNNAGYPLSHEKVRQIVEKLWRKGEILIDVKGRERIVRPNHVIVNSKSRPIDFRNFTILDDQGKPIQRIWISVYRDQNGEVYFTISESKWNGSWKTANNIIIPPEAKEELKEIVKFIEKWIENED